jgi:hypothetical protein
MNSLLIHNADAFNVDKSWQWKQKHKTYINAFELSIFYEGKKDDDKFINNQIEKAIKNDNIKKIVLFNFQALKSKQLKKQILQTFPKLNLVVYP